MFGLHELFEKKIDELFDSGKLGVRILENGLEGIGIFITELQRSDLENQFSNSSSDILNFNFTDEQLQQAGFSSEEELQPKLTEVVSELPCKVEKFTSNLGETMQSLVDDVTDSMVDRTVSFGHQGNV